MTGIPMPTINTTRLYEDRDNWLYGLVDISTGLETGLLAPADWAGAAWIGGWRPGTLLRKDFVVGAAPARAPRKRSSPDRGDGKHHRQRHEQRRRQLVDPAHLT
jgi:hypothetical protein